MRGSDERKFVLTLDKVKGEVKKLNGTTQEDLSGWN